LVGTSGNMAVAFPTDVCFTLYVYVRAAQFVNGMSDGDVG